MGSQRVRITRTLSAQDVRVDDCENASLNGSELPIKSIPDALTHYTSDVVRLILSKSDVLAEFELDFRISSEEDLCSVDEQFRRMALGGRLDTRAIEDFISATSGFVSAIGYCDGICSYLYGVLALEHAPDSSLSHKAYGRKFRRATEELTDYERPLARVIRSLIEFHFNHFAEAASLGAGTRVGQAAAKYVDWLQINVVGVSSDLVAVPDLENLVTLLTDWDTEQIVRWAVRPQDEVPTDVKDIEAFLDRDLEEFDRVKLHVLLGQVYAASSSVENAVDHAKPLRNRPAFEKWAEQMIRRGSRVAND